MARKGKRTPAPPARPEPLPPALLEAVARAPADDVPRLVAADWFAEHGQPERAELIALQCRLERLEPASPEREGLLERTNALLRSGLAGRPEVPHVELGWVRGFAGSVAGEPADLLAAAAQLSALPLPVERLALGDGDARALEKLVATPFWAGVRVLHLEVLSDRTAPLLLESGALARVAHLAVGRVRDLDRRAWGQLARGASLGALRSLVLRGAPAGPWCRAAPSLPRLELLGLEHCNLTPEDLRALARSQVWPRLQTLDLAMNPLAAEGAETLAAAPPGALRGLDLSWCRLGPSGLRALAAGGLGPRILKLRHDGLSGAALDALLDAPLATNLEWLDVRGNEVGPATLQKLAARWGGMEKGDRLLFRATAAARGEARLPEK